MTARHKEYVLLMLSRYNHPFYMLQGIGYKTHPSLQIRGGGFFCLTLTGRTVYFVKKIAVSQRDLLDDIIIDNVQNTSLYKLNKRKVATGQSVRGSGEKHMLTK
ncbi:hypothetical protein A7K91_19460 [Paenibacillus oryzae]|uniref:Uncharacterized protein n=1 Tax=Paenibacillus oryzae TaxID=1844972 RepID=A0A1A5YPT2_9BACL|nr:hypothetical protein A7K91_19460 [Paenibacillus oryzae]